MEKSRKYKFKTPQGTTSKIFHNLVDAWRYLRKDSPDLSPRDLMGRNPSRPLLFADGYSFVRIT